MTLCGICGFDTPDCECWSSDCEFKTYYYANENDSNPDYAEALGRMSNAHEGSGMWSDPKRLTPAQLEAKQIYDNMIEREFLARYTNVSEESNKYHGAFDEEYEDWLNGPSTVGDDIED